MKVEEIINKEQVDNIIAPLTELLGEDEISNNIITLLGMPEEDFELLSPGVLKAFEQSVNNPNDKIMLAQSLNASGGKAEDLFSLMEEISKELEEITTISPQKKDFLMQLMGTIVNAILDTEGIAKKYVNIPIELCHENAVIPQYAHISDSGLDIYALDDYTIAPGETKLIPTGIKVALPPGYELQVRPKSGRTLKTKLRIANTPGTIDAGYRDEIKVIIENIEPPIKDISYVFDEEGHPVISSILHGSSHFIGKGEKFAQLVLMEVPKASFYRIDSIKGIGEDRQGGFGSTGLN